MEERDTASEGYDLPPLLSMIGLPDLVRGRAAEGHGVQLPDPAVARRTENITGYPAPPDIAAQMYARAIHPTMLAKVYSGQSNKEVIAWAKNELEGFVR